MVPNSLRSKLSKLRYKRQISDEEYKELLNKLNGHDKELLDKIKAEIIEMRSKQNVGVLECLDIIDKYKEESEVPE